MPTNTSTIIIKAPAQKIWDALTKPELVKQWQYGSKLMTNWNVGSDIKYETEWEGKILEQWGKILELIPLQIIKYSLFAPHPNLEDKPENYFVMTYTLQENEGNTLLKIIQEDNRPGAKQEEASEEENPVLSSLKTLCES